MVVLHLLTQIYERTCLLLRHHVCLFIGDLKKGAVVLEWLMDQKSPDDDDKIEEIKGAELETLIETAPNVAVYFCTFTFLLRNVPHRLP